jgi:hypothetical protein
MYIRTAQYDLEKVGPRVMSASQFKMVRRTTERLACHEHNDESNHQSP